MKVFITQSGLSLCYPMDYSSAGFSVHGILWARILEWVANSLLQGIFLTQRFNLHLLHCKLILYHWATWEAQNQDKNIIIMLKSEIQDFLFTFFYSA